MASPRQGSARRFIDALVEEEELAGDFPAEANEEAERHRASPATDDTELRDLREVPFVTIDGASTRDLDQALYVERAERGFLLRYAIADASFYVRPGSALFTEALRRGASTYFPDRSVPMLPRSLSEGAVSLNPDVDRRALIFEQRIDETGEVVEATIYRARIRSQAKLAFEVVADFLTRDAGALADRSFAWSLAAFAELGRARIARDQRRGHVRFRRDEVTIDVSDDGENFSAAVRPRNEVERYNEQLSLLCNIEGARFLDAGGPTEIVQPLFRVHGAPDARRRQELEALLEGVARVRALAPEVWTLGGGRSLAALLDGLPSEGPAGEIARAVHRQALVTGTRSEDSAEPAAHFGVGAERYARFSAPMREIVGVYCHKEVLEKLGLAAAHPSEHDIRLREEIVTSAAAARERQRRVEMRIEREVLDRFLRADGSTPRDRRPARAATVMGITPAKVYVTLDIPPLDFKVYVPHLEQQFGLGLRVAHDGAALVAEGSGAIVLRLGDRCEVRVMDYDHRRDRWVVELFVAQRQT